MVGHALGGGHALRGLPMKIVMPFALVSLVNRQCALQHACLQ